MSPALLGSRLFHWGHYETEKEGGETDLVPEPLTGHTRHRVGAPVHENPNLFQLGHQDDRRTRQCKLCTAEGRFCALEVQLTKSLKVQGVPHSIKKGSTIPSPSHTRVGEVVSQYLANQECIDKMPRAKPTPETNINVSVIHFIKDSLLPISCAFLTPLPTEPSEASSVWSLCLFGR